MIKSISCFNFLPKYLSKPKWKLLVSVIITWLLSPVCTSIIIVPWLNCCKAFCWFYYADTKHIVFAWFRFFTFYELIPAFICGNNTGSLVNSLFRIKTLIPFPSFASSPSPSGGGKSSNFSFLSPSSDLSPDSSSVNHL